ncbi:hypothetical protein EVAR_75297_1 [Eumeta japonica]|uniref:Reverse transcriptase domain-containing protein n=1 Tax=Eumeta variegata TaxID=151549 RepID=A0A4C1Z011_EUMVA|nr:hypothetical protein EVAR_75297_1 [Eumeta japonica]
MRKGFGSRPKGLVCFRKSGKGYDRVERNDRHARDMRQGYVASPWLFKLLMNDCLHNLKEYESRLEMDELSVKCLLLRLGVTLKSVTLGNVTMSHRTREARRMPCVSPTQL